MIYIQKILIKIALSNNDDKRIVSSNKITGYPYGYKGKKCID